MPREYSVQFSLPVDNPENNVLMTRGKNVIRFEVPINHPDVHNLGIQKLLEIAHDTTKVVLLTDLNKKKSLAKKGIVPKDGEQTE
jgi:hypothetical protein